MNVTDGLWEILITGCTEMTPRGGSSSSTRILCLKSGIAAVGRNRLRAADINTRFRRPHGNFPTALEIHKKSGIFSLTKHTNSIQ
jgi:hypothetical protein